MKTAFLYAGQGSQKVGMGKDFYERIPAYRSWIDSLEESAVPGIRNLMHEGPIEKLSQTQYTQACMSAFAAGLTMLLKAEGIVPEASCGLSLGEYGALYAAGVWDAKTYVELTAFRGRVMMEAAEGLTCSMSAILGADAQQVEAACNAYDGPCYVTVANYNCPGQIVICGDEEAVAAVESALKEQGVRRCVRLNVSGPFHTRYMKPAGERLEQYLKQIPCYPMQIPVTANVTGDFYREDEDVRDILVRQVQNGVQLEQNLRNLLEAGYDRFLEIGPGAVVSGFLRKTAKTMNLAPEVRSVENLEEFEQVVRDWRQ